VVCGPTGSGKSRLLQSLARLGAQVLDLEDLAAHRGSVLGDLPHTRQPSQKMFDSRVWWKLRQFDPARPVYVEAESKKIGNVRVADALIGAMWQGQCIRLEIESALRIRLLKEEYAHFLEHPETLHKKLDCLIGLHGHERIDGWKDLAQRGLWDELVRELLERHYDPAYTRSTLKHYPQYEQGILLKAASFTEPDMTRLARELER
jgi:tRNA 2-selenouridine synthase